VTSLVLDVNGLSIRMHSLRKTPTCEGRGGRLPSCRDSCSTHSLQRRNQWSPQRPALQCEDAGLGVPPVRADRIDAIEVGEHEDVEQLGAGSGTERVQALRQQRLEFVDLYRRGARPIVATPAALSPLRPASSLAAAAPTSCSRRDSPSVGAA
jgi:hypothetical protein